MDFYLTPIFSIFIVGQVLTFNLQENPGVIHRGYARYWGRYIEACPTIKIFLKVFNDTVLGFPFFL
jgi:hypothetical protein